MVGIFWSYRIMRYHFLMSIKFIRIFLLILIIIGFILLMTQPMWVPKVVAVLLRYYK